MSKKIIKHELVEVLVPAGSTLTQFQLPELNNLRQVDLWGVQVYYNSIVPKSVISQKDVIVKSVLQNAFLTLTNYDGKEFLKQCPMVMFQTIENSLANVDPTLASIQEKDFKAFAGQKVNYPKSYINVSAPVPVALVDQVFLLSIFYVDPAELGKKQTTFRQKN